MTKVPSQIQCLTIIGLLAERGGKKGGTSFENTRHHFFGFIMKGMYPY